MSSYQSRYCIIYIYIYKHCHQYALWIALACQKNCWARMSGPGETEDLFLCLLITWSTSYGHENSGSRADKSRERERKARPLSAPAVPFWFYIIVSTKYLVFCFWLAAGGREGETDAGSCASPVSRLFTRLGLLINLLLLLLQCAVGVGGYLWFLFYIELY